MITAHTSRRVAPYFTGPGQCCRCCLHPQKNVVVPSAALGSTDGALETAICLDCRQKPTQFGLMQFAACLHPAQHPRLCEVHSALVLAQKTLVKARCLPASLNSLLVEAPGPADSAVSRERLACSTTTTWPSSCCAQPTGWAMSWQTTGDHGEYSEPLSWPRTYRDGPG